jgi:hypothetical protein
MWFDSLVYGNGKAPLTLRQERFSKPTTFNGRFMGTSPTETSGTTGKEDGTNNLIIM